MRIGFSVAIAALGIGLTGCAPEEDSNILSRQQSMKTNGAALKVAFNMAEGNSAFVAADAATAMKTIADSMTGYPDLFPVGSEDGSNTRASPKIWEDMGGFKAEAAKMVTDAKAAEIATVAGFDAFKAAVGPVGENCKSCHETYRTPKKN